jgi:hypothetical protein
MRANAHQVSTQRNWIDRTLAKALNIIAKEYRPRRMSNGNGLTNRLNEPSLIVNTHHSDQQRIVINQLTQAIEIKTRLLGHRTIDNLITQFAEQQGRPMNA